MPLIVRLLLISVVSIVTFSNSLENPMLLDDFETITENRQIRRLDTLDVLMPERELPVAGRPLANLTFALNYAAAGEAVRGYHATNLALHLLCALVAYLLVEQLLRLGTLPAPLRERAAPIALTTALLWSVHPLNSEVVNYLTQRTESLMALFFLLTLYCATRALDSPDRRWTVLAIASCALGALCKESIAVAPLAVLAIDRLVVFPSWRETWRRRRGLYVGLAASWLVLGGLQATGPRPASAGFTSGIDAWTYLLNQAVMVGHYIRLALWPRGLSVIYGLPRELSVADVVPQALLVVALLAATIACWRRWPGVGAAGTWFFLTLAPTSSILPIATEVGAERRMYLPLLAIALLAAVMLWVLLRNTRLSVAVSALLVIALASTTLARNREYADPLALAELTLARWPTGMAHELFAEELLKAGRREEAMGHLRTAVIDTPRAHFTLGLELYNDGRLDQGIAELQSFVRLEPTHLLVPDAEALIARAYARQQRWDDALRMAQQALTKAPNLPNAHLVLAEGLFRQSRFAEAVRAFRRYLALRPSDIEATTNLAISLMASGQREDGLAAFRHAADIDPGNWQTRRNLALALLDAGRAADAVTEARRAIDLKPDDAVSHTLLGQGLAGIGQFEAAMAQFTRALELNPDDVDAQNALTQLRRR